MPDLTFAIITRKNYPRYYFLLRFHNVKYVVSMVLFQGFIAVERIPQIGLKIEQEVSDCPRKRVEQVWMSAHVYRP
jgi:hypothetical protein